MSKRNRKLLISAKLLFIVTILAISASMTVFLLNQNQDKEKINLQTTISKCSQSSQTTLTNSKEYCYSAEFKKISAQFGPVFAFQKLDELKKIDQSAKGCHWIAHGIGTGSYIKDPKNWRSTLTTISQTCNYGAQHGIIEAYIATLPEGKITAENIQTICGSQPLNDCNHIVGHIVLVNNLGDVDNSLKFCEVFTQNLQNHYCNQGVFMENITALNLIDHKIVSEKYLDWASRIDEIKDMCKKYSDPIALACWEEITHATVLKYPNNPAKVFEICDESPSDEGRNKCKTHAIGIITANLSYNLEAAAKLCKIPQKLDPDFEKECYANIVGSMLSTVPEQLQDALVFCSNLSESDAKNCFEMVHTMVKTGLFTQSKIIDVCESKLTEKVDLCKTSGKNLELYLNKN